MAVIENSLLSPRAETTITIIIAEPPNLRFMLVLMNIEQTLLTKNIFSRPGKKLTGVKGIVIHWVANPGSGAKANRNYFESLKTQSLNDPNARYASAHFIVGLDGGIVQCIPTDEMAYHVVAKMYTPAALGALVHYPNNCTIGIELCHPDASGKFTAATLGASADLAAELCNRHRLSPVTGIWRHFDVTGKDCPKCFVENHHAYSDFKHSVLERFVNFQ